MDWLADVKAKQSRMIRDQHLDTLRNLFTCNVWRVTEWRNGAVYHTEKIGEVVCWQRQPPIREGADILLSPK